jgi:NADPH-dependent ferric siderophore reductase
MIVLGDMSALGHYLALQQLAGKQQISGAIAVEEDDMAEFENTFKWNVQAVKKSDEGGLASLSQWAKDIDLTDAEVFIAGHIPTGIQLRKELKKRKDQPNSVRVQGFWS